MTEKTEPKRAAPVWFLPQTGSTNTEMKRLAREGAEHGTVLIAAEQTAGRGRMGRSFASPKNGLYLTILLRPDCAAERLPTLTPCAAIAVCRALKRVCGMEAGIKWPNDILFNGKKLCGILTEGIGTPDGIAVVLGIGLNVNTAEADFPAELRGAAASIRSVTGRKTDMTRLSAALIAELDRVYDQWLRGDRALPDEYRRRCVSLGREYTVQADGEEKRVYVLSVEEDFSLSVRTDGETKKISAGEIM